MSKLIVTVVLASAYLLLESCATVTQGTTQNWYIKTEPEGASVKTSNGYSCPSTPCHFRMSRTSRFVVTVSKTGFKVYYARIRHQTSKIGTAGVIGDALTTGVGVGYLGIGLDAATGATEQLLPNPLMVKLVPLDPELSPPPS